jgi:hypothetical protein
MNRRLLKRCLRGALAILIFGLTFGAGWAVAQSTQAQAPMILSGSDIGFRVDRQRSGNLGRLTGAWVVRVNGQWVEPDTSGPRPLSTR